MKSLIKDPVREAVREALEEERTRADDTPRTRQPDDETDTGNGNRLLRPQVLLPVLGLTVAAVILGRRWLMKVADVERIVDRSEEESSPFRSGNRTAAGTDPAEVGSSTGHGSSGEDASQTHGSSGYGTAGEDASQTHGSSGEGDDSDEPADSISHKDYRDESDDVGGVESEE